MTGSPLSSPPSHKVPGDGKNPGPGGPERRAADDRLVREAALEAVPNPIALTDLDGTVTWVNAAFCEHWRVSPDQVLSRPIDEFVDVGEEAAQLRGQAGWAGAGRALGHPAGPHVIDVAARVVRGLDGVCICRIVSVHDARAYAHAAEELRVSQERLLLGQRAAQLGYWEWHLGSKEPWWSSQVFEMVGRDDDRPQGLRRACFRAIHPEDLRWVYSAVREAIEAREPFSLECRVARSNGDIRHLRIDGEVRADPEHGPGRIAGTVLDVTEQRLLTEELRQAQRLHTVGRLAGGVAHDFNNLLTSIMGYVDLLQGDDSLTPEVRADVDEVAGAVARAAELAGQLLTFSRKEVPRTTTMDVTRTLGVLERMLGRLLPERIRLTAELSPDPTFARIDATQLEQVILNLAVNARDAIAGEGAIYLGSRIRDLEEGSPELDPEMLPGRYVLIEMSDTGVGMDEDTLAGCFDPFFTTKETGTGLGLASVQGTVTRSGGSIRVQSEPGRGTTFLIHLPCVDRAESVVAAVEERSSGAGEHVFVVEDDDGIRLLAQRTLEAAGYRVSVASNGADALEAIRLGSVNPDLVVADVIMPVMGGVQLAREMEAMGVHIPVLFLTGHNEAELASADFAAEEDVLRKPYDARQLARAVGRALERARRADR